MGILVRFFAANSLWLVGLGLMLASSGIDGAYMARWMTDLPGVGGAAVLGYILNTTSDVAGMVLTYWFGRLQQAPKNSKQHRLSWFLVGAELVAVGYSWLFSWRQLRIVLLPIEGEDAAWVSWVAAGFIPLLLAFVGYAQALLAGRIERQSDADVRSAANGNGHDTSLYALRSLKRASLPLQSVACATHAGHGNAGSDAAVAPAGFACEFCGRTFGTAQGVSAHMRFCAAYQAHQARTEVPA